MLLRADLRIWRWAITADIAGSVKVRVRKAPQRLTDEVARRHHPGLPHHEVVCTHDEWAEVQDPESQEQLAREAMETGEVKPETLRQPLTAEEWDLRKKQHRARLLRKD